MDKNPLTVLELQHSVEQKAYAFGVSKTVSTLIGEYVIQLLKEKNYVRTTKRQLV